MRTTNVRNAVDKTLACAVPYVLLVTAGCFPPISTDDYANNPIVGSGFTFEQPPERPIGAAWIPPVREIPVYSLPDIAAATYDTYGPVIIYNPQIVQQAGPVLSEFFRAHEYGHIALGHVQGISSADPYSQAWIQQQRELDADCYAAQTLAFSFPNAVLAAYELFYAQGFSQADAVHPTGYQRADAVARCSGL